jgi:hypothetical protein
MADQIDTPAAASDLRTRILAAAPLPRVAMLIPEWGQTVYVRMLRSGESDAFDRETIRRRKKEPDRVRVRERMLIGTVEDADGRPLFKPEDEDALAAKGVGELDRLFRMAVRMTGRLDDDEAAAEN